MVLTEGPTPAMTRATRSNPSPISRWPRARARFSLRSLLLLTTLGCVAAAGVQARERSNGVRWRAALCLVRFDRCLHCESACAWRYQVDEREIARTESPDRWWVFLPGFRVKSIDLSGLEVASAQWEAAQNLRETQTLSLRQSTFRPCDLAHLERLPALRRLDLGSTGTVDEGLKHLAGLCELRELSLAETRITDTGLASLARLRRLERLDLSGTAVTDAGLRHLEHLQSLVEVRLYRTGATPAGVARLDAVLPHCVRHNPLVLGPTDAQLAALPDERDRRGGPAQ